MIVNRDRAGRLVFSGRVFDRGEWMSVSHLYVVGSDLERYASALLPAGPELASVQSRGVLARWSTLLGKDIADLCRGATVGFVGCSGTGSPAVEVFARAQLGRFVLVDEQRFAGSNLERMHGSVASDITTEPAAYKVALMARMIQSINPSAHIVQLVGNGMDDAVVDELLRCDVILGGTDTLHGRALLGDLASLYLVPSIDIGVLPRGLNGRVTSQLIELARYGIGEPCPFCQDRIPALELHAELIPPEERARCEEAAAAAIRRGEDGTAYWQGGPPQLPAVGYLTTAAGAMAAGYALNWLLGTATMPHQRMQFDLGVPEFGFVSAEANRRPACGCVRWQAHGDQGERAVTMPAHFAAAVRLT
ncbi:MAG: ThiF family adenylyltransferase [Nibricoccus sp.]